MDILNRLAAHLAGCSRPATLETVLDELADYAVLHFETEERVWREWLSGDGWLEEHEQTHRGFFERVDSLRNGSDDRPHNEVIQEIVLFLSQWLAYHILESDKRMAFVVDFVRSGDPLPEAKHKANERMSGSMRLLIETVLTMYDSLSSRTLDLMREKVLRKRAEQALLLWARTVWGDAAPSSLLEIAARLEREEMAQLLLQLREAARDGTAQWSGYLCREVLIGHLRELSAEGARRDG
ncbi:MAG: hypothetical protein B0D84_02760 [Candidatus Sedimenticola endophacoides]|uniref:Hemerythrin-like domain-containing protein n=1 Tax=Candidatus Sedimenticola endophacoides TaxID=2548426 RepID=A0A657PND9_9GAMM|nr:MAG: hypothetical protein B0D84_02760 [Candidatus Sedimenticola endophacoides]